MEIDGITLWLFGGVAQFRGMFPTAGAEFRIAIAGPLVSLVIGAAFVGLAVAIAGVEEVDGIAAWLGYINLALLVFNLLPALPLDGGRVLRSALWAARSDFSWATRVAAAIGRAFGALFIAGGLALFFFENGTSGLWLAFLGWFLFGAASEEARYAQVHRAFAGLRVRDLMVPAPSTIGPEQTIGELMDGVVWTDRQDAYPVVDDGRVVGLLPFRVIADVPRGEWERAHGRRAHASASGRARPQRRRLARAGARRAEPRDGPRTGRRRRASVRRDLARRARACGPVPQPRTLARDVLEPRRADDVARRDLERADASRPQRRDRRAQDLLLRGSRAPGSTGRCRAAP